MIFIKNIEEYNPNKERRYAHMLTETFIRGRKLNISLVFSHNLILLYRKILD